LSCLGSGRRRSCLPQPRIYQYTKTPYLCQYLFEKDFIKRDLRRSLSVRDLEKALKSFRIDSDVEL
jgi:hypothetical protein